LNKLTAVYLIPTHSFCAQSTQPCPIIKNLQCFRHCQISCFVFNKHSHPSLSGSLIFWKEFYTRVLVKAVNATTVEVTFKDAVENLNSLNFTIEGLTVSNAAIKQTDNKTVVLTTAVQKGGEKYTVSLNNQTIGSFTGISAVVPTKLTMNTDS